MQRPFAGRRFARPRNASESDSSTTIDRSHQGFEIVGISLDADEAKATAYVEANNLGWPMSWSERGWQDEPPQLYMVNGLPSAWLIDKNGILRHFNVKGEDLRTGIQQLLSEARG